MSDYLGNLKVMGQDEDKNFYVRIEIVRSGPNRNGWDFQNMETLCKTFLGTPILCAYVNNQIGDGHNFREKTLPTGEQILDFTGPTAERIVGAISDDPNDIWTEEREDGTWAVANGKIWRFYNRQLVDRIALQGSMSVSAEIETYGGSVDENGVEVYDNWTGLGVTILHESVPPAVPGANIQAIRAMSEEFKELKFKAASYHPAENAEEQDLCKLLEENDPKPTKKGMKKPMSFNRQEAERLAPLFDGYRIVGLSDDSKRVVLMSDNFGFYSYTFSEDLGNEVVASCIAPVKAISVLCGNDETGVYADMGEIVKIMSNTISTQDTAIENLNAQVKDLRERNDALTKTEHDRRIELVKASVQKALADIAEGCDNAENCDNEAAAVEACAEDFAAMEDGGKFCGDKAAYDKVMSAYGMKVAQKRKDDKAKAKSVFAWDNGGRENANDDGIAGMLARING